MRDKRYIVHFIVVMCMALLVNGCGIKEPVIHNPWKLENAPQKFAIFFDGTAANESSYTNVSKLFNLTSLQPNTNVNALYSRGVGNGADVLGKITGRGIKREVCKAYLFLARNYQIDRKDELYFFGFSRGAYAARVLAGFIHIAGIQDVSNIPEKEQLSYVKDLFEAHKIAGSTSQKKESVYNLTKEDGNARTIKIEFLGLWDTVAAIGLPTYSESYFDPSTNYTDQLCNVNNAVHALSINDNRSAVFTPLLLTQQRLVTDCNDVQPEEIAEEVWFFGAHSDVGGGVDSDISGVSLNWMIEHLEYTGLLPENTSVHENMFDKTDKPTKGVKGVLFSRTTRKLAFLVSQEGYKKNKLKVHHSVLKRLEVSLKSYEINLIQLFSECFEKNDTGGFTYRKDADCFEVIY